MEFNNLKYSKKHDTYRTLVNVYNYDKNRIDVFIRSDYKIVVTDDKIEEIIEIPERIKIESVQCDFIDDNKTILMLELKLKDLDINVKWK